MNSVEANVSRCWMGREECPIILWSFCKGEAHTRLTQEAWNLRKDRNQLERVE